MKSRDSSFYVAIGFRFLLVIAFFSLFYVMFSGVNHKKNLIRNMNGVKSIEATHIISSYDNRSQLLNVREVSNMEEAKLYGPSTPISFNGQMTAYTPVCAGCSGKVFCSPRQDVHNGNVFYLDNTYGRIHILAADSAIPCGSIVKVTNVNFSSEPIIGIVLDRGGAIKGNIMDFLMSENDNINVVGRQLNVHYELLRWGW